MIYVYIIRLFETTSLILFFSLEPFLLPLTFEFGLILKFLREDNQTNKSIGSDLWNKRVLEDFYASQTILEVRLGFQPMTTVWMVISGVLEWLVRV